MIALALACAGPEDPPPALDAPTLDDAALVSGGPAERLGELVAPLGDADGDGRVELAVGGLGGRICRVPLPLAQATSADAHPCVDREVAAEPGAAAGGVPFGAGAAWAVGLPDAVVDGAPTGRIRLLDGDRGVAEIGGRQAGDRFGATLLVADLDDDGVDDLLVGAPGAASIAGVPGTGVASVFFGPLGADVSPASVGAELHGGALTRHAGDPGDALAVAAAALDADGDGVTDLLLSQGGTDGVAEDAGAAFLFLGPVAPAVVSAPATADARFLGTRAGEFAGEPLLGGPDLDGDGRADVVVAANGAPPERIGVFSGRTAGDHLLEEADARLEAASPGEAAGAALAAADLDADGHVDLLVGAPFGGAAAEGAVHLVLGPTGRGVIALGDLPAIVGRRPGDELGRTVVGLGIDGFAVGTPGAASGAGVVAIFAPFGG